MLRGLGSLRSFLPGRQPVQLLCEAGFKEVLRAAAEQMRQVLPCEGGDVLETAAHSRRLMPTTVNACLPHPVACRLLRTSDT